MKIQIPQITEYPVSARHIEPSALISLDDELNKPSKRLVELTCDAGKVASELSLDFLSPRMSAEPYWANILPGEHYKFLAAIVRILKPSSVIEIGTDTGLSSLAILSELSSDSKLYTFDIIPWKEISNTVLCDNDFNDGRLIQSSNDLTQDRAASQWAETIKQSELIFVDAAKDAEMEWKFIELFYSIPLAPGTIVIFDDIRVWNMLAVWRSIAQPKLDATSFGHWSGTGLVEWVNTLE